MTTHQLEIQLIALITASACAIPGVFLILRKMAMMSDSISHSILFGIAAAFFIVNDINSPFLLAAAALTGMLNVFLVELLSKSKLVKEDTAIGLIFPFLFSIGVIMISRYAGNIHLDIDAVLLGEIAFAPWDRLVIGGIDIGPKSMITMSIILFLNILFVSVFYKELKFISFDPETAGSMGFSPTILNYSLMGLVSVTAVGAFDAVGSILVVALMIAPPASAYLLTDKLSVMIILSVVTAVISSISGYWTAHYFNVSIAGSIASVSGLVFVLVFLFSPDKGILSIVLRKIRQKFEFAEIMLLVHVLHHEKLPEAEIESNIENIPHHLKWNKKFMNTIIERTIKNENLVCRKGILQLTDKGREYAKKSMTFK